MNYSWAGTLPAKLFKAYPKPCTFTFGIILIVAAAASLIAFGLTGNTRHLYLGIPVTTWLSTMAAPILYGRLVRDVRIVTPKPDGPDEIDLNHWWKKDFAGLDENKARYEHGRRVFWLAKPAAHEHAGKADGDCQECDPQIEYFTPEKADIHRAANTDGEVEPIVDSSEVFGLAGWVASGSSYVFTKSRTMRELVQMGVIAAIIVAELIAVFMLTGRFNEDAPAVDSPAEPAAVQANTSGR